MSGFGFIGRSVELAFLHRRLDQVTRQVHGTALAIRGRRQVGKSRLVQEFCDEAAVPYLFFSAIKGAAPVDSVSRFCRELAESSLPEDPGLVSLLESGNWFEAFKILASVLPATPSIVVLDELPWLAEQDPTFDGSLQMAWDRLLSRRPVVLLLLGSDLHMMERLTSYDRPFYGRADPMILGPLNPAETARATGLSGADAIDAQLASGGLPGILRGWPHGMPALDFIRQESAQPVSPLFAVPEATLMAEFPSPDIAHRVLEAIGSGDRTQANIAATAGGPGGALVSGTLSPILHKLTHDKRVVAMNEPLSTRPGKPALYHVADSNLRLYLAALRQTQEESRRGRPEVGFRGVERRWSAWRGRAVEPLIRDSLAMAADGLPWPETTAVGGWWNRSFKPEVDLVGADRGPVARQVFFTGSVKWLDGEFDGHALRAMFEASAQVPGVVPGRTGTVVVSRSGMAAGVGPVDVHWGPEDIVGVWPV
ncbi:ATP-binding protein [Nonomuraea turkmeniaca]|uniref:ATP-binding protein n=1 Tax=Nonomuraea turkmeniaca TaxID=103838 RepID=A0A5S4FB03_9ACTN|nr:ATP-binding protein [Nonomuraea turkmeniaca]TMR14866.1 ATP-binding protein [Nonomuraea turkmeniaca]